MIVEQLELNEKKPLFSDAALCNGGGAEDDSSSVAEENAAEGDDDPDGSATGSPDEAANEDEALENEPLDEET